MVTDRLRRAPTPLDGRGRHLRGLAGGIHRREKHHAHHQRGGEDGGDGGEVQVQAGQQVEVDEDQGRSLPQHVARDGAQHRVDQ